MTIDFAYWAHTVRAIREGFRPLSRKQFVFRFEICMMGAK